MGLKAQSVDLKMKGTMEEKIQICMCSPRLLIISMNTKYNNKNIPGVINLRKL